MKRPKPTQKLVMEVCGKNQGLVSSACHGLHEASLRDIYHLLDFDEAIAFAASSWKSRKLNMDSFAETLDRADLYELFSEVYKIGMPWLNKHKDISPNMESKHQRLNPFNGRNLQDRLSRADERTVEVLKEDLIQDVNKYVFEIQYQDAKRARGGSNYKLEIMNYQLFYPQNGKIVPAFASEVARTVSSYPKEYIPL